MVHHHKHIKAKQINNDISHNSRLRKYLSPVYRISKTGLFSCGESKVHSPVSYGILTKREKKCCVIPNGRQSTVALQWVSHKEQSQSLSILLLPPSATTTTTTTTDLPVDFVYNVDIVPRSVEYGAYKLAVSQRVLIGSSLT